MYIAMWNAARGTTISEAQHLTAEEAAQYIEEMQAVMVRTTGERIELRHLGLAEAANVAPRIGVAVVNCAEAAWQIAEESIPAAIARNAELEAIAQEADTRRRADSEREERIADQMAERNGPGRYELDNR